MNVSRLNPGLVLSGYSPIHARRSAPKKGVYTPDTRACPPNAIPPSKLLMLLRPSQPWLKTSWWHRVCTPMAANPSCVFSLFLLHFLVKSQYSTVVSRPSAPRSHPPCLLNARQREEERETDDRVEAVKIECCIGDQDYESDFSKRK